MGRILIFLCILFCSVAKGQPVADFTLNNRQGCAPFIVPGFTNLSTGNQLTYLWDFGNGITSTEANPRAIVYATDGSYTVKLTVTDAGGRKDSAIKNNFITVYKRPSVNFITNNKTGCVPYNVQFTDLSTPGSGTNSKWEWDFGDGQTSQDKSPSHAFTVGGNFTITLKVTNSFGCEDVNTKTSFINVNERPKANFTSASTSGGCSPPIVVNYTNTSTTTGIKSIKWDFGDGLNSTESNPSHSFTRPGTYAVTLIITGENGCIDSITKPTVIGAVNSQITVQDNICQGALTKFTNASTPAVAGNLWDFGDGTTSIETNPVKSYSTPGSYVVKLVNHFGGCKDSITKKITVLPKPVADFSFTAPPPGCTLPVNVSFTPKTTGADLYSWSFGDSTTSNSAQPTHSYTTYGTFSVQLKVTAANGCSDTITKPNVVSIIRVHINKINGLPFAGCAPYQSIFSADVTSPNPVSSYLWNFGDGQTSTASNPVHNYTSLGSYDVFLKIATSNGCTDSLQMKGAVVLSAKPKASFSASSLNTCASDSVQFTNLSTGTVTTTKWDFGDNSFSIAANPTHHYVDTGFFTVKLVVSNSSCSDSSVLTNYIHVKPPIAKFSVVSDCATPLLRRFQNKSILAQTFEWSFGDGSALSAEENPQHVYKTAGIYFVRLKVSNGSCFDVYTDTIEVINEIGDVTLSSNKLCRNSTMVFTATNVNDKNIVNYSWDFGDSSNIVNGTNPVVNHNYLIPGNYNPALTITDRLGCVQRIQKQGGVTVYGPIANFTNPEGTCLNKSITFIDNSRPTANHPITNWIINYGDGKVDSSTIVNPTFSHTYTTPKSYNVALIAVDNIGCRDTLLKTDAVNITNPKASFTLKDSISCNNSDVNFINQTVAVSPKYLWNFGDGTTETTANPSHSYKAEGTYNIFLSVKDRYGCVDSIYKPSAVIVQNAKAMFTLSDSLISCPPAQVNFVNNSTYSTGIKWDFSDGGFSNIQNPSHYFLTARTYNIKLIAFGHGSCADSTIKTVTVKGPSGTIAYNPLVLCGPAAINFTGTAINSDNSYTWDFGDGSGATTVAPNTSHVYTSKGKFLPKLILVDSKLKCTVYVLGADSVAAPSISTNIKSFQSLFCDSATLQFFDSSKVEYDQITNYLWSFGDGVNSNAANPFHTYTAPGVYPVRLTLITKKGCTDTSKSYSVKVVKSPETQITGPSTGCVDQSVTYSGISSDTSAVKWTWDFGNGVTDNTPSPPSQIFHNAGDFTVKAVVANSSGCATTATKVVTVYPLPNVDAGSDSVICRGSTITLHATGADSYIWTASPNLSCTACANPTASGTDSTIYYTVTGKNAISGCQKTDSVQIKVIQPFKILASGGAEICEGQSFPLFVTGADKYNWSPSAGLNNSTIANPIASPTTTTLYTVTGHDYLNCFTDTATIPVTVYPNPTFDIIQDEVTIAVGNSVAIKTKSSPNVTNWQWLPSTGLSCSNCSEPIATPSNTIVYKAFAITAKGCKAEDRITINVFCNNGNLFVPNTFSPNNDGVNDVFFLRGKGISGVRSLQIFNRWGAIVFQKNNFAINDPSAGWDGTFNNKPASADAYIYQIDVVCETGEVFSFKGNVSLIR